jgi:arylsulfatase A-like enzyme
MKSRRSLVLVTVDCLRADHVGFMGHKVNTTPFLDSLASRSFVVPTAIVAGTPTYYSLPAILASRYPLALGRDVIGIAPGEVTLASVLQGSGYATACFAAANPYISPRFGYDQGFDTFRDFPECETPCAPTADPGGNHDLSLRTSINHLIEKTAHQIGSLGAVYDELYFQYCQRWAVSDPPSLDALRSFPAADAVIDEACKWLASAGGRPFFLWLHLMDPHAPYYPTEEALEEMGHAEVTPFRSRYLNSYWNRSDLTPRRRGRHRHDLIALYDAGIRWVDKQLERLVQELERSRRWDDCAFVLTADHGEEFLEHGGCFHPPSKLTEEIVHVPLLIRVPGTTKTALPSTPFSHLHLAPTLLDAIGLVPPSEFQGRSLWLELQSGQDWSEPAIVESIGSCTNPFRSEARLGARALAVREDRYKLVLSFDPHKEELFDLATDPTEQNAISGATEKATRRRLLQRAQQHLEGVLQTRHPSLRLGARMQMLQLELAQQASFT